MKMKAPKKAVLVIMLTALFLAALLLCVCAGSVKVPLGESLTILKNGLFGGPKPEGMNASIVLSLRLPRVLCAALMGAALSLCGVVMQGLLRNPLADGSTLGISTGAALGAALSIVLGISIPGLPIAGSAAMAMAPVLAATPTLLQLEPEKLPRDQSRRLTMSESSAKVTMKSVIAEQM